MRDVRCRPGFLRHLVPALLLGVAFAGGADAHPLHTTLTEVRAGPGGVRLVVRVFADDLARALPTVEAGHPSPPLLAYLGTHLVVAGPDHRPVRLGWRGMRRTGDLLWIELFAPAPLAGSTLRDTLLTQLYSDQVNVVHVSGGTTERTLLFVRGDGAKRILD